MFKVPLMSLNAKTSSIEKYFPAGLTAPWTLFPLLRACIMLIAWQTESLQPWITGNSFTVHKLTNSWVEPCKHKQINKKMLFFTLKCIYLFSPTLGHSVAGTVVLWLAQSCLDPKVTGSCPSLCCFLKFVSNGLLLLCQDCLTVA